MLNQELTYNLPIDSKGKLKYLCTLMRLNQNLLTQIPEEQAWLSHLQKTAQKPQRKTAFDYSWPCSYLSASSLR